MHIWCVHCKMCQQTLSLVYDERDFSVVWGWVLDVGGGGGGEKICFRATPAGYCEFPPTRRPPPATAHPQHILNTAYVQTDDTEQHVAKSQSNYFWVSIDDLHYSSLIHAMWSERVIWMKNCNSMCKKLSFIGDLLGTTFWRSLQNNRTALPRICLVYTNTAEHNTLTDCFITAISEFSQIL